MQSRRGASQKTAFRIGYDKDHLYLAVRCDESSMSRLVVSAKPQPEIRDLPIEDQDVLHILLASPHERNSHFAHFCVNAAGEVADILMNWKPGQFGWYHRGALFNGVQVQTARDATGWQLEMSIPFSTLGTYGGDAVDAPWTLQIVRCERPHGETSAWNPGARFPHGPDHFGILFLARAKSLYVECQRLLRLAKDTYAIEAIIRKLGSGKQSAVLTINKMHESSLPVSLVKPLAVVFFPWKVDRKEPSRDTESGATASPRISHSIYFGSGRSAELALAVMEALPIERQRSPFSLLGPSGSNGISGVSTDDENGLLVPEARIFMSGRCALAIHFDLPIDDEQLSKTRVALCLRNASTGRSVAETSLVLAGRSGVLALDTSALQAGAYVFSLEGMGKLPIPCKSFCRFSVVGN